MTLKQISSFAFFSFFILSIFSACNSGLNAKPGPSIPGLPPDPGISGMETIAGVDSDNDGVRDDIQRYIVLTYPDQPEVQKALRQNAKARQAKLLDADDETKTFANRTKTAAASECLFSIDQKNAYQILRKMEVEFLNTKERILAQNKADSHLSGHTFGHVNEWPNWSKSCTE